MYTHTVKDYNGPSYAAVHTWINKLYGRATHCENPECPGKGKAFQWALKPGHKYAKSREAFQQLCKKCHTKQDLITHKREVKSETIKSVYKELATVIVNLYPSDYEKISRQARERRTTMAQVIHELLEA